ncbi:MAG TPA: hypothetical protein DD459_00965 [Halieaceae bacterium]|nr:hypothetical protein [Halieaceae bacterium]|tara:strand:+ start:12025 stop:14331 length:2307 start_codon:yes stop_codon:yes gene_type:complete
MPAPLASQTHTSWPPLLLLLALIALFTAMGSLLRAPVPVTGDDAPTAQFSGQRALHIIDRLLPDDALHAAGSNENRRVRDAIVAELDALGLDAEIQRDFKCSTLAPGCSTVENIVAVIPGSGDEAVLLTAHYDSVPGSPGVADDLHGAAVMLESAANLLAGPPRRNNIVLLFSDAEETGLRGAMAFQDSHPLARKVRLVLNLEARGVTGPGTLFETGQGNLEQIARFAASSDHPVANSLLVEVYRRMPNGTDYMVYGKEGTAGLNFAFSGGVALYHSARDDRAHLDPRSLQHQGDNIAAALDAFADSDLGTVMSGQDATYFDLFGQTLLYWPADWSPYIAATALLLLGTGLFRAGSANSLPAVSHWVALAATFIALPLTGYLLSWPLSQWHSLHPLDHPYPWPARIALLSAAALIPLLVAERLPLHQRPYGPFALVWSLLGLAGLVSALLLPGASYLFLAPVATVALVALLLPLPVPRRIHWASWAGVIVAGYIAYYHFLIFEAVFNFNQSAIRLAGLFPLSLALLCLFHEWRESDAFSLRPLRWLLLASLAGSCITATLVPVYTADRPRAMNVQYVLDVDQGQAWWELFSYGPVDTAYLQAAGVPAKPAPIQRFGAITEETYRKAATVQPLAPPEFTLNPQHDRPNSVNGTIHSVNGAFILGLALDNPDAVDSLLIDGQHVLRHPDTARTGGKLVRMHGAGTRRLRFELNLRPGETTNLWLFEQSVLPLDAEARALQSQRPDNAAPIHFGDHAQLYRRIPIAGSTGD